MLPLSEPRAFAVLSDVHANLGALEACLVRVDAIALERGEAVPVVFLGDVLDSGPSPAGTLALALERGSVFLRGNHEDYVFDHRDNPRNTRYLDPLWRFIPWTLERLTADAAGVARLRAYERACVPSSSTHGGRVRFFHASPETNAKSPAFITPQATASRPPALTPPFEGEVAALCFSGHNHYAGFHENPAHAHGGARELWVNAGSVGYPFVAKETDDPVATFAFAEILDSSREGSLRVRVRFEAVAHSGAALASAFRDSGCLASCAPFSWAILAQCAFNEDVVYPFFKKAKAQGWRQADLPGRLEGFLTEGGWRARLDCLPL